LQTGKDWPNEQRKADITSSNTRIFPIKYKQKKFPYKLRGKPLYKILNYVTDLQSVFLIIIFALRFCNAASNEQVTKGGHIFPKI
jgi:hypothetical protein